MVFTDEAVDKIIQEYTREAGIRNLERRIATICRKIARESLRNAGRVETVTITPASVEHYLAAEKIPL